MTQRVVTLRPEWQVELQRAYTDPAELLRSLELDPKDYQQDINARRLFPMRVPRHFAHLMTTGDRLDPLLLQVLPLHDEFIEKPGFSPDPINEQNNNVITPNSNGLLHKYDSRVLLIFRGGCAVNCRYCFRRHFPYQDVRFSQHDIDATIEYIKQHAEVNEVILSGGDPLMASNEHIARLLNALELTPQITRIRIHSRLPVVIPERLDEALLRVLTASPIKTILVLHANHPNEISNALTMRLAKYRQAGVHLFNQSVLLRRINDNVDVLSQLSERLFDADVLPYYLHQLDKVSGATHFEVNDQRAQQLWQQLNHRLPGFLVPKLVRDVGGERSKTPIMPSGQVNG